MASTNKTLADGVQLTTSVTTLYTSPTGLGTRVVAFNALNFGAGNASYTVHIVPALGTADNTNMIVKETVLIPSEDDSPIAVINQLIPPGGTLEALSDSSTRISVRASGIEFT